MTVFESRAPLKWAFLQRDASLYSALLNRRRALGRSRLKRCLTNAIGERSTYAERREWRALGLLSSWRNCTKTYFVKRAICIKVFEK